MAAPKKPAPKKPAPKKPVSRPAVSPAPKKPVSKPAARPAARKGDDPSYRPRMTDPVSGRKLVKGQPVPAAYSKDVLPDTGPMSPSATRGVPTPATLGPGIFSGINVGPPSYAPDPRQPYLQRFTNTQANRRANAVGRMVNPRNVGQIGGPDPGSDALRRGYPVEAEYDGSAASKIKQALNQLDEGLRMHAREGRGDPNGRKPPAKKKAPPKPKGKKGG
jgi:hypothetical protein